MLDYSTSAETIYNVTRQLNSSLDLTEALGNVLRLTVEAASASKGSLFLLDETGCVTRHILARPDQSPEMSRHAVNTVMAEGLAGWVYRHRCGALAADTGADERWVRLPDDEEITGSALVVPLLYRQRVNGLLALHHQQIGFFDESHVALAEGIAGQAAVTLENARLFTQVSRERESLFALINAMPIPVLVVDDQNAVAFANPSARECLPEVRENIPLDDFAGGDRLKTALDALAQTNGHDHTELVWPDNRVFSVSVNQVGKVGAVVALDDITYLKELDEMKTQFVETVSHDLKNPLGVIMGFAQLLEMEPNLTDAGRTSLQGINNSARRMLALISDLLDLARIEAGMAGAPEPNDLARIVRDLLPNFTLQLEEKSLELRVEFPDNPLPVLADRQRLEQIVANFVSNAIKYNFTGGQVLVKLEARGKEVWFSVSDTGPGIPPAAQAQLFQKFYRVPEVQEATGARGTGLGLSIVKAIAEASGGRVWVKSRVGQGSTFGCALPLYSD